MRGTDDVYAVAAMHEPIEERGDNNDTAEHGDFAAKSAGTKRRQNSITPRTKMASWSGFRGRN